MEFDISSLYTTLVNLGTTWGFRIVGVLFVLFVANVFSRWAQRRLKASLDWRSFDATLTRFFANMVRYVIIGGALLGCLGVFGIQTASFAAVIAALGLAIGLALQGTLSNFAAGVMLLVFRPYKIGDLINVAGQMGIVAELQLFTTNLKTLDNRSMVLPNSAVFGQTIENITKYDTRRVDVPVGVVYSADIEETRKVLEQVPGKVPDALTDPAPQIFLASLGASSVDWQVRIWCPTEKYWDVYQAMIMEIKRALDSAGLGIPFPQMDVHFDPGIAPPAPVKKAS